MNNNSYSNSYKDAGVDVTAGYKAVELMKQYVARTVTKGVLDGILLHKLHSLISCGNVNSCVFIAV